MRRMSRKKKTVTRARRARAARMAIEERRSPLTAGLGITSSRPSPTEQRNRLSLAFDRMPLEKAIRLMLAEEASVPRKLLGELRAIERAVTVIVRAFRAGGRLFYVGAGTSGRLGVLDASECPPTFGVAPGLVQGIIAGGRRALWQSVEGAEDEAGAGAAAIRAQRVTRRDVVVGIAASGATPFVWGALREAKARRASTVLVAFNPFLRTLAMVRLGKVMSNLMIDLNPSNRKLRGRAARIVQELTGAREASARAALERSGWRVRAAVSELGGPSAAAPS